MRSVQDMRVVSTGEAADTGAPVSVGAPSGHRAPAPQVAETATVSFQTELPEPLQQAMRRFIERHPNWDHYRLVQAALAGFLVQNGVSSRAITRLYVGNLFCRQSLLQDA
jgi:Protein of unknown function (DUF2811).